MRDSKVTIREFRMDDYEECVKLWRRCGLYVWYMDNREDIEKFHRMNKDMFLVAEINGEIVGTVMGLYSGNFALIYHLGVLPEYRLRGIGRRLVMEVLERLKKKGARFAFVIVHSRHRDALGFYRKLGFRSVGKFTGMYIVLRPKRGRRKSRR